MDPEKKTNSFFFSHVHLINILENCVCFFIIVPVFFFKLILFFLLLCLLYCSYYIVECVICMSYEADMAINLYSPTLKKKLTHPHVISNLFDFIV